MGYYIESKHLRKAVKKLKLELPEKHHIILDTHINKVFHEEVFSNVEGYHTNPGRSKCVQDAIVRNLIGRK